MAVHWGFHRPQLLATAAILVLLSLIAVGVSLMITDSIPLISSEGEPLQEDAVKPRASGQVGSFIVTKDEGATWPSCDQFHAPTETVRESELYFGMVPDVEQTRVCADGTVLGVVSGEDPRGQVARWYFVNEAKVYFPFAPAERVKATEVAGLPAIVAEPFPGLPAAPTEVVVLERAPTEGKPGIMLDVYGSQLSEIIARAEQVVARSSR